MSFLCLSKSKWWYNVKNVQTENNCPKPNGIEQCKDVIKCAANEKQVSCPMSTPQPCLNHQKNMSI